MRDLCGTEQHVLLTDWVGERDEKGHNIASYYHTLALPLHKQYHLFLLYSKYISSL